MASRRVRGPQLSAPLRWELRAELHAAKAAAGLTWEQVAADAKVPYGAMRHFLADGHPPRLEWAVRLAAWCGLELVLAPRCRPHGVDEFGDPVGDEGEGA